MSSNSQSFCGAWAVGLWETSCDPWQQGCRCPTSPQQVPVQGQAEQSGQELNAVEEEQNSSQSAVTENEFYKLLAGKFNKVLEHTQEATGKLPLIAFSSTPSKLEGLKSEGAHGGYIACYLSTPLLLETKQGKNSLNVIL
ncbi:hypothetical protein Moror_16943 [Moniliophthora roreri MCA 2997]|uniref:Uncharacterized protein n=1 Tax=Moniliophthora roreri (strain MCA 2997) TaxID=1381753 RepID=V2XUG0_MONRO|nr:hypothetical protein Moror_16943 [Moniliophthora roreri MCA 2997]